MTDTLYTLAARIDRQMRQLEAGGVSDEGTFLYQMMGHAPDLYRIWTEASDPMLMALANGYPGFCHYALLMEKASMAEMQKPSRPYDELVVPDDAYRQQGAWLLTTLAAIPSEGRM
jgi:hypothetical protein